MLVADVRPAFVADCADGVGVETAHVAQQLLRHHAAHIDGAGAALFCGSIVEKGIWICVEQSVRKHRGHGGIDGNAADLTGADLCQHVDQTGKVPWLPRERPS